MMFAHNSGEHIDYTRLAVAAACMVRRYMEVNGITLVTSDYRWLRQNHSKDLVDRLFEHIIEVPTPPAHNTRIYRDTPHWSIKSPFYNQDRHTAYDLSPYEETLVMDVDYLVQDDRLDLCWGEIETIGINRRVRMLDHQPHDVEDERFNHMGIHTYWATLMYFRKSPRAKLFFDLVEHIRENYSYYQVAYGFQEGLYRNDYVVSIAVHLLNGFLEYQDVKPLPVGHILTSSDRDELIDIRDGRLYFLVNDTKERWRYTLAMIEKQSVHVMNKFSIGRQADKIIELYQ